MDTKHTTVDERFYFTGKPCKAGHIAKRYVTNRSCVECERLWRIANHERKVATTRASYDRNKARANERSKQWTANNLERQRANFQRWVNENREHTKAYARKYLLQNRERLIALHRERYQQLKHELKGKYAEACARKRARLRAAEGTFTKDDVLLIGAEQGWRCAGCMNDIAAKWSVDHVTSIIKGGTNWPSNIQLLCRSCNTGKRDKLPNEWFAWTWTLYMNAVRGETRPYWPNPLDKITPNHATPIEQHPGPRRSSC